MAVLAPDSTTDEARASQGPSRKLGDDLGLRAGASAVLMAAALAAAWAGGFPFLALWLLAAGAVLWEWQKLVGGERLAARIVVGGLTLCATALALFEWQRLIDGERPLARLEIDGLTLVAGAMPPLHGPATVWTLTTLAVGAVATGAVAGGQRDARVWAGAGVVYAGALVAAPTLLRASPAYGLAAILWLYAVVWGTDTVAYFAGRLIGGPKLWRRVSPGKTWAGALVGALAGASCGAIVGPLAAPDGARFGPLLGLGLVASVVAQLGDLFESAVKRRFRVKDSGRLIPGHGGMMDRLDGFVAAAAFAALVGWARSGGDWIAGGLFQW